MSSSYCISLEDVQKAASRIQDTAHRTPVLTSASLDEIIGRRVVFKVEALQKTGSFKFRGALNAVRQVLETTDDDEVSFVTHSSGNHAQALALAAKLSAQNGRAPRATIVMPENTPSVKKAAVIAFGGIPIMVESTNEARESEAERVRTETGAIFVHPSEDPRVIAGQGTVCLELVEQVKEMKIDLDVVVIPVGGGGLASGNITTLRALLGNRIKIVLAEPAVLDDAKRSFDSKELKRHAPDNKLQSVADGLKTTLGPNTWPIIRDLVNDVICVSERDILRATKLVWERLKVCIEPSAGVGVAVAMSDEFRTKYGDSKTVGIVLCGGNVDVLKVSKLMAEMGL